MGWYLPVYNRTLDKSSKHEYKYGRATMERILEDEPDWSSDHVIVGGGMGEAHMLLSGYMTNVIVNKYGEHGYVESYTVEKLNSPLTECPVCQILTDGMSIVSRKVADTWYPDDNPNPLVHCSLCHNIWDGHAQCMCSV